MTTGNDFGFILLPGDNPINFDDIIRLRLTL